MTLLEYVQTLSSDISITEKIALTKAWKNKNDQPVQQPVVEEEEEEVKAPPVVKKAKFNDDGSLNVDSFSDETKGSAEKVNKDNEKKRTAVAKDTAIATQLSSEKFNFGNGKSLFQESEWLKSYKKEEKNREAYEKQQARLNSVVSKDETYADDTYDFKWNVNNDGVIEYYQKEKGVKDWKLEKENGAIFSIADTLGHLSKENKQKLKEFNKQKLNQKLSS